MSEETPSEREERLQKQEERLEKQHNRIMESRNNPSQPSGKGGLGKGFSGILSFFGEHKLEVIFIAIGVVFISVIVAINRGKTSSTGTSSAGNQQGNLSTSPDAGTAYALTQLTDQLNTITNLLNQQGSSTQSSTPSATTASSTVATSTSTTPTENAPPADNTPPPVINTPAPDTSQYVTVTPWPSSFGSLSGIAQTEGITLSRVESLNPQLFNQRPGSGWNLIYPGQRVRIA